MNESERTALDGLDLERAREIDAVRRGDETIGAPEPGSIAEAPTIAPVDGTPFQAEADLPTGRMPELHELPTGVMSAAQQDPANRMPAPQAVRYFGDYEVIRELARGGMGVVFLARQISLNRPVALKMILAGQLAHETDVRRFYTEAEAAANLDHPGIVPIYEVGQHEGRHYFSMGFVEGQSLSQRLAEGPLPPRDAAELIAKVADAIEYAHRRGVIHRDLKPGNILLDPNDNPRVTDFGLAKKLEGDSGLTGSGQIMGTPSYMPPEQAGGNRGEVGPAADVYALGATLYALITGRPPFQAATPMDTVIQVIGEEPVPPRRLNPGIPRDLETIVLKCLEKEPGKRYGSAAAMVDDLRLFLNGEPIVARPITRAERAWKWSKRRPALSAALAACAAMLVAAMAGGTWFTLRLRSANESILRTNRSLEAATDEAQLQRNEARSQRDEAQLQRNEVRRQRDEARHNFYAVDMDRASRAWEDGQIGRALELLGGHAGPFGPGEDDLRSFEWHYLRRACEGGRQIIPAGTPLELLAISPDGATIAATTYPSVRPVEVRRWDARTGAALPSFRGHPRPIKALAFHPDGKMLATDSQDGVVRLWDVPSGRLLRSIRAREPDTMGSTALAFSPDGRRLAYADSRTDNIGIWDVTSDSDRPSKVLNIKADDGFLGQTRMYLITTLAFSPDARRLIAGHLVFGMGLLVPGVSTQGGLSSWDVETGRRLALRDSPIGNVHALGFLPGGPSLLVAGADGMLGWNDALSGDPTRIGAGGRSIGAMAVRPDGKTLAIVEGGIARLWDVAAVKVVGTLRGHRSKVTGVAFFPDGKALATAGPDGVVWIWDPGADRRARVLPGHERPVNFVTFSPDSQVLASACSDGVVRLWAAASGRLLRPLRTGSPFCTGAAFEPPDGRRIATPGGYLPNRHVGIAVWDSGSGKEAMPPLDGHNQCVSAVAYSRDGRWLASVGLDERVRIYDARTGREVRTLKPSGSMYCLAFSPDGKILATGGADAFQNPRSVAEQSVLGKVLHKVAASSLIQLWDLETGSELRKVGDRHAPVSSLSFSPDGRLLASAGDDWNAWIHEAASGTLVRTLYGESNSIHAVAFSPDGKRVATGGRDTLVRLWDVASGRETLVLPGHTGWVNAVAFSPDGHFLASAGCGPFQPGEVLVWDAGPPPDDVTLLSRVEDLLKSCLLKDDALDRLQKDASLTPGQRSVAARLLAGLTEDPDALNRAAREVGFRPDASAEECRLALRRAEAAHRLDPDDPTTLGTLGAARYRAGQFRDALADLNRWAELRAAQPGGPPPAGLAFLAMAQHRLGQTGEAVKTLARLRDRLSGKPQQDEPETRALFREASALLGPQPGRPDAR